MQEEIEIGVEYLDQQIQVLWLCHANLGSLTRLAELGQDHLASLATLTKVEMRGVADGLSLQVFLQKLVLVAENVSGERLEVFLTEASQRVQC